MATDIVLFLHDAVPRTMLLPALETAFGLSLESADAPDDTADGAVAFAEYAEGFALGVGIATALPLHLTMQHAAQSLADMLKTDVLLENAEPEQPVAHWLLLSPGIGLPCTVQIVELRHGLAVTPTREMPVRVAEAIA